MLRFTFMRNCTIVRYLHWTRRILSFKVDSQNILFGGQLHESYNHQSVGRLIYERLSDPSRADKIIQVCAATGNSMNTATFLKQSVAVAEGLMEQNIRKGDFVVLVGNNSLNMNISVIGVLLLGAVAVPISHEASPVDLRHLLTLIRPKFFICDSQTLFLVRRILSSVLGPVEAKYIFLLDNTNYLSVGFKCFPEFINGKGENWKYFTPVEVKSPKQDLVFVMKSLLDDNAERGVGLTHENILSVILRYESKRETLDSEVILMVQKIIWIAGMYSLLLSCCFGSKLVVMNDFEEEFFMRVIETYKVTFSFMYPRKLWKLYKHKYSKTYDLSSCKRIYVFGPGVPTLLMQLMKEKTGLIIVPAYGKSEMAGIVVEPDEPLEEGAMGRLVRMCYAKVFSAEKNENCGPNTPGEVCFKGPSLMRGYVNDDKSTRNAIDAEGFFHTGDYGYFDEQGNILVLDRLNGIVKYKNYEISPLEVEGVLRSHESVKDCVVSGLAHPEDGYRIVGFIVVQQGKTLTPDEINKFMENKLPDHKLLKGGVVFIPKVPRSGETGYIKRRAINKILSKYRLKSNPENLVQPKEELEPQGEETTEGKSPSAVPKTNQPEKNHMN